MRTIICTFTLCLLVVTATAQNFPNGKVAAVVNGEKISQKSLYQVLVCCYGGEEMVDSLSMKVIRAVLEEMIICKIIEQKLRDVEIECTTADYADNMEFFEEPFLIYYRAWAVQNPQSFRKIAKKILKDEKEKDPKWETDMNLAWKIISDDKDLKNKLRDEIYRKYYLDRKVFRKKIKILTKFQKYANDSIQEKDVEKFAQEEKFSLEGGKVKINHILRLTVDRITNEPYSKKKQKKTKRQSRKIRRKIKKDLSNFGKVAAKYSQDDMTRYRDGEIGWVPRWPPAAIYSEFLLHLGWIPHWTTFVHEIIDTAYHLPENTVSDPIKTGLGYHLVMVSEKKAGKPLPKKKLKERARKRMTVIKMEKMLRKWLKESEIERKL